MDVSHFEDHLDRYGGDLAAWPAELRLEATVLMAASTRARAAFLAMGEVEAFFHVTEAPGGAGAMAARAMQHRQIRPVPVAARRAGWASAAVAALVLGLFVGDVGPRHDDGPDAVMAAALDNVGSADVD